MSSRRLRVLRLVKLPWLVLFSVMHAHAHEAWRPSRPDQLLIGTRRDLGVRVRSARVVIFNRRALTRDFPQLVGRSDDEVENWILARAGYLNSRQLALTGVRHSSVDVDFNDTRDFWI